MLCDELFSTPVYQGRDDALLCFDTLPFEVVEHAQHG